MIRPHVVRSICSWGRRLVLPATGSLALTAALVSAAQPPAQQSVTSITGFLNGVSSTSASDAWAVGSAGTQALIVHWNGSTWSRVTSPRASFGNLYSVSMVSATDGWAVGTYLGSTGYQFLVLHWNGTTWTQASSPSPGHGALHGVSMLSATDGWAAGEEYTATGGRALVLHWNGSTWSPVFVNSAASSALVAVSGASQSDAWAVGYNLHEPLIVRWNGTTWTPLSGLPRSDGLLGVSAASTSDVWTVGFYSPPASQKVDTLTLHRNATIWQQMPSPSPGATTCSESSCLENELAGVAIISPSNAWSIGDYTTGTGGQAALTLHWNGTKWVQVANEGGTTGTFLRGISMVSTSDGWAVGGNEGKNKVIILHWNGTTWSRS